MVNNKESEIVLRRHLNDKYYTLFNKKTGFFIRCEFAGASEPFWARSGPELIDISICSWCDKECSFCYRNANTSGTFMSIKDFRDIIKQSNEMGVYQVALGGGNPNQHPKFIDLLKICREEFGIVPSYTTNGRGMTKEIINATKKYCGSVAISFYEPYSEFKDNISKLLDNNIKTNIHFLLTNKSINTAIELLKDTPKYFKNVNAIIFLNYKPVGKRNDKDLLLNNSSKLKQFFEIISLKKFPFKIGFDSCSISGIVKHLDINSQYIEPCEAARFSMFISEDMKMYPCSFMIDEIEGVDIRNKNIKEIWTNNEVFNRIRERIKHNPCEQKCEYFKECMGGCPVFDDIILCK